MSAVSGWDEVSAAAGVADACFVCELVAGNPDFAHHVAYRDAATIVFLNRFPWCEGHVLVAPVAHREHVVADFSMEEFASLQRVLYAAGRALGEYVDADGLRISVTGASGHVHWHVKPGAADAQEGPVDVDDAALASLAHKMKARIRWLLAAGGASVPVVRR